MIRPATPADVPEIVAMIAELADFEQARHEAVATVDQLTSALFTTPSLYAHVAVADDHVVGFALWFLNFSTWRGVHGIYLEDLYVRPAARGGGHGRALLAELAGICVERGYARLDWAVLNLAELDPSRVFYQAMGARPLHEWTPYRLTGDALADLAKYAASQA